MIELPLHYAVDRKRQRFGVWIDGTGEVVVLQAPALDGTDGDVVVFGHLHHVDAVFGTLAHHERDAIGNGIENGVAPSARILARQECQTLGYLGKAVHNFIR